MNLLGIDVLWYVAASVAIYPLLWLIVRHRIISVGDPLNVGLLFLACSLSIVILVLRDPRPTGLIVISLLFVGIGSFLGAVATDTLAVGERYGRMATALKQGVGGRCFVLFVCGVIVANFVLNVVGTRGDSGAEFIGKGVYSENSRLLFLLSLYLSPILYGFWHVYRGTTVGWLVMLCFFSAPVLGTLMGSKGAIADFVLRLAFLGYLVRIDGSSAFGGVRLSGVAVVVAAVASLGVGFFVVVGAEDSTGWLLAWRVFINFDQIMTLIMFDFPVMAYDLDLFQLYFSSALKVLGGFDHQYNSIGHFVLVRVAGYPIDYGGQMPNSNLVAELALSVEIGIAFIVMGVVGCSYGFLYRYCFRHRYDNLVTFLFFLYAIDTPFGFLMHGAGHFTKMYASLIVVLPFAALDAYSRRLAGSSSGEGVLRARV